MANFIQIEMEIIESDLTSNSKILYGLIKLRSHKEGYCYSSNQHFEKILKLSKATIKRCLVELEENGLITRDVIYRTGTLKIDQRRIYINVPRITDEPSLGSQENLGLRSQENLARVMDEPRPRITGEPDNSTRVNSKTLNTTSLPNNIIDNKLSSSLADASEDLNLENFESIKEVWSKRIGDEEQAFYIFYNLSNKQQTEFLSHSITGINHGIIPTKTLLSDYLEDWVEEN